MEMTLDEQVFRKMGAAVKNGFIGYAKTYYIELGHEHLPSSSNRYPEYGKEEHAWENLPPIASQWEVCAKYLVPFMLNLDYHYEIEMNSEGHFFYWICDLDKMTDALLKDDNIALAACEAFMKVELNP